MESNNCSYPLQSWELVLQWPLLYSSSHEASTLVFLASFDFIRTHRATVGGGVTILLSFCLLDLRMYLCLGTWFPVSVSWWMQCLGVASLWTICTGREKRRKGESWLIPRFLRVEKRNQGYVHITVRGISVSYYGVIVSWVLVTRH